MAKLHDSLKDKEFWYRDMTLIPNRLPDFERDEVDLTSLFSKRVKVKTPLVSSPMDTVSGADMAIMMALMGGIGILHYNFPKMDDQIREVERVKRFEAAFVKNPPVLGPTNTVGDVFNTARQYGFFSVPITEDGTLKTKMIGFVSRRDVRYLEDMSMHLKDVMTPRMDKNGQEKLITANRKDTLDKKDVRAANKIIRQHCLDTLPIVDDDFRVVALVTDSDLQKEMRYTLATKDENKQLKVFIAVESRLKEAKERIGKGVDAGIDGIVVDASVVFKEQLEIGKYCKANFPAIDVVLGNVDSADMVRAIVAEASEYCDALRVGIGPGSACQTQAELGTGRAQASAVWDCAQEAKRLAGKYGLMPLIADGGVKIPDIDVSKPGDITKSLALGAQTVMMGSMLAGLDEAPGEKEFDYGTDRMVKRYRGMGSLEAMANRSSSRYGYDAGKDAIKIAEGFVTEVPYRGSGYAFLPQLIAGVKQSLQKQGFRNILELQEFADIRPLAK